MTALDEELNRTNHGIMHDVALWRSLRHVQGPCNDVHIIVTPGQSLDEALKACPVVPTLQAPTTSAQALASCRDEMQQSRDTLNTATVYSASAALVLSVHILRVQLGVYSVGVCWSSELGYDTPSG